MLYRLIKLIRSVLGAIARGTFADPQLMFESTYHEPQSRLIIARQALAQSIATEKQLEMQLDKNECLAELWKERAG